MPTTTTLTVLLGLSAAAGALAQGDNPPAPPVVVVVDTALGAVEGEVHGLAQAFKGIPYAEPPVPSTPTSAPPRAHCHAHYMVHAIKPPVPPISAPPGVALSRMRTTCCSRRPPSPHVPSSDTCAVSSAAALTARGGPTAGGRAPIRPGRPADRLLSRRERDANWRDCLSADVPSTSLLKRLLKGEGGCGGMTELWPAAIGTGRSMPTSTALRACR